MRRACGASAWRGGAGSTRSRFWLGFPGASSRADRILRDFSARHQGGPVDAGSLPGGARCQRTRGRSRARGARGAGPPYRPLPPARSRPRPRRCRLSLACRLPAGRRPAAAYTIRRSAAAGPGSGRSRLVRLRRPLRLLATYYLRRLPRYLSPCRSASRGRSAGALGSTSAAEQRSLSARRSGRQLRTRSAPGFPSSSLGAQPTGGSTLATCRVTTRRTEADRVASVGSGRSTKP